MAEEKSRKISDFFEGVRTEFKKIVWPTREDIVKQTIAVISSSIAIGVIIAALDWIFQILLSLVIR